MSMPRIALLMTGNELMTGDIVDSNSAYVGQKLFDLGMQVAVKVTLADSLGDLQAEIKRLSQNNEILIVNGGLGPTEDDLTAFALANAAEIPVAEHPQARRHLEDLSQRYGFELGAANLKQAQLPEACDILPNPIGTAVGFALTLNDCRIFCTPGVPKEFHKMLDEQILPHIASSVSEGEGALCQRMQVFGIGESSLQEMIDKQYPDWPEEISVGFRADLPMLELKLQSLARHQNLLTHWEDKIRTLLGTHIISESGQSMTQVLIDLLREQGKQFTCAESCTGGLVASQMTQVAGASDVFEAGFVTYSNSIKHQLLGVGEQHLQEQGAVSEVVVREMLQGALEKSGANVGVAISGIAGPGGGTPEKPVGTVWLAWGSSEAIQSAGFVIPGSRYRFQVWVATMALDLVRRFLLNSADAPHYDLSRRIKVEG